MTTFDPTKPVQTRDERAFRILCTDRQHPLLGPIVGLMTVSKGTELYSYRDINGRVIANTEHPGDLINIPDPVWVNVYRRTGGLIGPEYKLGGRQSSTRQAAQENAEVKFIYQQIKYVYAHTINIAKQPDE